MEFTVPQVELWLSAAKRVESGGKEAPGVERIGITPRVQASDDLVKRILAEAGEIGA